MNPTEQPEDARTDTINLELDWLFSQGLAEVKRQLVLQSGSYFLSKDKNSSFYIPQDSDVKDYRTDQGAGFETFSIRLAELWRSQGDNLLLELIPHLEACEMAIRDTGQAPEEKVPEYTYTLF